MTNLPNWPGASEVYRRAEMICSQLNAAEYKAQRGNTKRFRCFSPSAEADAIIRAMNAGDEEALKAATYAHRNIWLDVLGPDEEQARGTA